MLLSIRKGFTLIELIIVIIIIGILAAISAPMMQNIKAKAIASEALMGMSAVRQAAMQYNLENPGKQLDVYHDGDPDANSKWPSGIKPGDLTGTYFSEDCYDVILDYDTVTGKISTLRIRCYFDNDVNKALKATEARSIADESGAYLVMDKDGNITGQGLSRLGYKSE